ncbi:hypothetical protein ACQPXM_25080 [Kribbella sp. CA-253562]|uniref:hypothetical protein n=1 Tax=Kribbella sp. CA-253562 TaxID=3239942 RepID=UPI003D9242CE
MAISDFTFPDHIDQKIATAAGDAAFGRNVLATLVDGLQDASRRPRTDRQWGPGVLGCSMWMDDPELIDVLSHMANVCVVITKQLQNKYTKPTLKSLTDLAATKGILQAAYPELAELAPRQNGQPLIVGPSGPSWVDTSEIGAVREVGFRKVGNQLVPIVHAKIMLLGRMAWTDEHPSGDVGDYHYFVPEKLWIGSANFTKSSRTSLEMGLWTTDKDLIAGARDWLLTLVGLSEPLGSGPDVLDPELLSVEYDEAAIAEYLRDQS